MGRVFDPDNAGKQRKRYCKDALICVREMMKQSSPDDVSKDLAAYICLCLLRISETIEKSVDAWEKRGYWVKADRFRLEWEWAGNYSKQLKEAILKSDWILIAQICVRISEKLYQTKIPKNPKIGTPWIGAFQSIMHLK